MREKKKRIPGELGVIGAQTERAVNGSGPAEGAPRRQITGLNGSAEEVGVARGVVHASTGLRLKFS